MKRSRLSKKGYEDFRVQKFARGSQIKEASFECNEEYASQEHSDSDDLPDESGLVEDCKGPDTDRVILHFDADCFYAQVEELRDPKLQHVPLGITQKFLVVTCNYPARRAGVTKLMAIEDAKRKCPGLVLVSGEDLTPYRQTSRRIFSVLQTFGSSAERLGMDEVWVDVSAACRKMLEEGEERQWHGHVHRSTETVESDNVYRPMDVRATGRSDGGRACSEERGTVPASDMLLQLGSEIAKRARRAVKEETGIRTSAGIAHNKLLAKLASGLHKPDDQTSLPSSEAADFVAPLSIRAIRGAGYKTCSSLQEMGVDLVRDLRRMRREQLTSLLGMRAGMSLYEAARGRDKSEVVTNGAPKRISVEDSFKSCSSFSAAELVLQVLAPDLIARVLEDAEENRRVPECLVVSWRHKSRYHGGRHSCSTRLPSLLASHLQERRGGEEEAVRQVHCDAFMEGDEKKVSQIVSAAMAVLRKNVSEPFHLTLINLAVTNFINIPTLTLSKARNMLQGFASTVDLKDTSAGDHLAQRRDYDRRLQVVDDKKLLSKRQERMISERMSAKSDHSAVAGSEDVAPTKKLGRGQQHGGGDAEHGEGEGEKEDVVKGVDGHSTRFEDFEIRSMDEFYDEEEEEYYLDSDTLDDERDVNCHQEAQGQHENDHWHGGLSAEGRGLEMSWGEEKKFGDGGGGDGDGHDDDDEEEEEDEYECEIHSFSDELQNEDGELEARQRVTMGLNRERAKRKDDDGKDVVSYEEEEEVCEEDKEEEEEEEEVAGRVVLHVDVDAFYCAVERMDDPLLLNVPIAVQQFNSGGFVAVSYEAQAKGIRKGDGVGAGGSPRSCGMADCRSRRTSGGASWEREAEGERGGGKGAWSSRSGVNDRGRTDRAEGRRGRKEGEEEEEEGGGSGGRRRRRRRMYLWRFDKECRGLWGESA